MVTARAVQSGRVRITVSMMSLVGVSTSTTRKYVVAARRFSSGDAKTIVVVYKAPFIPS